MKALPANNGMAFILVQHLDPTHESMMADLLAGYTSMTVGQAQDRMRLERDHLYVIPPGTYLSVADGALRLSEPPSAFLFFTFYDYTRSRLAASVFQRRS